MKRCITLPVNHSQIQQLIIQPFLRVPLRTPLKTLPRNVWVVTLTSFLTDISSEMIFNLLPLFLTIVPGTGQKVLVRPKFSALCQALDERTCLQNTAYSSAIHKPNKHLCKYDPTALAN